MDSDDAKNVSLTWGGINRPEAYTGCENPVPHNPPEAGTKPGSGLHSKAAVMTVGL